MKRLLLVFVMLTGYVISYAQAPATATPAPAPAPVRKVREKEKELRPKEDIIDFIFAKSQKYNVHFAEYKRNADTIFFNAKVKAEVNINEIDTITVTPTLITIVSKLGIQKFNYDKKKMCPYPDLQLPLEAHDWDFYEENLYSRLTRASQDYMKALRLEQAIKRKAGHDPNDPY